MAEFTTRPVIQGHHGVVAAGHYLAAEIAMRVLDHGGNAVDAGVAAVFALTVLKPQSCGIAGECPILLWRAPATDGEVAGTGLPWAAATAAAVAPAAPVAPRPTSRTRSRSTARARRRPPPRSTGSARRAST